MPFPQPKRERPTPPRCAVCDVPMVVARRVPLSYAPTFETVHYRCPECRVAAQHDAVPILDDDMP